MGTPMLIDNLLALAIYSSVAYHLQGDLVTDGCGYCFHPGESQKSLIKFVNPVKFATIVSIQYVYYVKKK